MFSTIIDGLNPLQVGFVMQQATLPWLCLKTVHRFWRLEYCMLENVNQDDNSTEAQVQSHQVQQPLEPACKHHCVFHAAQLVPGVTRQSRHSDKQCWKKQWRQERKCGRARCSQKTRLVCGRKSQPHSRHGPSSRLTSPKMAEMQAILCHDGKQLHFKEAALLVQETAVAEDKGKLQAMLFAMLQE
jgi:hypothetical protein